MTEEYAKGKLCCQFEGKCAGSNCMAWRWIDIPSESKIEAIKRHRNDNGSSLMDAKYYVERHPEYTRTGVPIKGFCGLAGKP